MAKDEPEMTTMTSWISDDPRTAGVLLEDPEGRVSVFALRLPIDDPIYDGDVIFTAVTVNVSDFQTDIHAFHENSEESVYYSSYMLAIDEVNDITLSDSQALSDVIMEIIFRYESEIRDLTQFHHFTGMVADIRNPSYIPMYDYTPTLPQPE